MTWKFWVAAIAVLALPKLLLDNLVSGLLLIPAIAIGAITFRYSARKATVAGIPENRLRSRSGIRAAAISVAAYFLLCLPLIWPALFAGSRLSDRGMIMAGGMLGLAGIAMVFAGLVAYLFGTGTGQRTKRD